MRRYWPLSPSIMLLMLWTATVIGADLVDADGLKLPAGFSSQVYASRLTNPTRMIWGPDARIYVAEQDGRVVSFAESSEVASDPRVFYSSLPGPLLGLAFVAGDLFVSYRDGSEGKVSVLDDTDGDGVADSETPLLTGLPVGNHQNDHLLLGPDGLVYLGIGSRTDRGPEVDFRSATIVRFRPDGGSFEVYATGLRNPYGMAFDANGRLFATDNGPDSPAGPDELNLIVQNGDYGFWRYFGDPPEGSGTMAPVAILQTHSSSDGFVIYKGIEFPAEFRGNAFIAQWGSNSGEPGIGRRVVRVRLEETNGVVRGKELVFAEGLDHPVDVLEHPDGSILVADHGTGTIHRIRFVGPSAGCFGSSALSLAPLVFEAALVVSLTVGAGSTLLMRSMIGTLSQNHVVVFRAFRRLSLPFWVTAVVAAVLAASWPQIIGPTLPGVYATPWGVGLALAIVASGSMIAMEVMTRRKTDQPTPSRTVLLRAVYLAASTLSILSLLITQLL